MARQPIQIPRSRSAGLDTRSDAANANIANAAQSIVRAQLAGSQQAGAGLRSGLQQAGAAIGAGFARKNDPQRKMVEQQIAQQQARQTLAGSVEDTTPRQFYEDRGVQVPTMGAAAASMWDKVSGSAGAFEKLDAGARERITQIMGGLSESPMAVGMELPEGGPTRRDMIAQADPAFGRDERMVGIPEKDVPQWIESQFRQQVFNDPQLNAMMIRSRLAEQPALDAAAEGRGALSSTLRKMKNDPKGQVFAKAVDQAVMDFDVGMINGQPRTLMGRIMDGRVSAAEVQQMMGQQRVMAHPNSIGKNGQPLTATSSEWLSFKNKLEGAARAVANAKAGASPQMVNAELHKLNWSGKILDGLRGQGAFAITGGRADRVKADIKQLSEKFSDDELKAYLGAHLLGLDYDGAALFGTSAREADLANLAKPVLGALKAGRISAGGRNLANRNALEQEVFADWGNQLTQREIQVTGPLSHLREIPPSQVAEILNDMGDHYRGTPMAREMAERLRAAAPGQGLEKQSSRAFAAAMSELQWMQDHFQDVDPKGRSWGEAKADQPAIRSEVMDAIVSSIAERVKPADPKGQKMTGSRGAARQVTTAGEARQLFASQYGDQDMSESGLVNVEREKDGVKETIQYRDGRPIMSTTEENGEVKRHRFTDKSPQAGAKQSVWRPAMDAFNEMAMRRGGNRWREAYPSFYPLFQGMKTQSGVVNDVLEKRVGGRPIYQHIEEVMRHGKGAGLTTAYDNVVGTLRSTVQKMGYDLGVLNSELDFADAGGNTDPVVKGLAILLEEGFASKKMEPGDLQFLRTIEKSPVIQMPQQVQEDIAQDPLLMGQQKSMQPRQQEETERRPWYQRMAEMEGAEFQSELGAKNLLMAGQVIGEEALRTVGKVAGTVAEARKTGSALNRKVRSFFGRPERTKSGYQEKFFQEAKAKHAQGKRYFDPKLNEWIDPGDPEWGTWKGHSFEKASIEADVRKIFEKTRSRRGEKQMSGPISL